MCICMRCALNGNVCPFPFIIQHTLYTSYSDADLGPSAPCYGWSVGAGGWWALANLPSASRHCGHSASSGDLSLRCVPLVHTNSRSPSWLQGSLSWSNYHAKDAFYGAYASPDSPVSAKWQGLIAVLMTNNTFTGLAPWSTTGQCALNQAFIFQEAVLTSWEFHQHLSHFGHVSWAAPMLSSSKWVNLWYKYGNWSRLVAW